MPVTRGDCIALLKSVVGANPSNWVAYHEKISGFIPDGGASQMFEFGRSVERVGCILETLGVRVIEVGPQTWQKALGLGNSERTKVPSAPRGCTPKERDQFKRDYAAEIAFAKAQNARAKKDWKNKLKAEAQRRYPALASTLKTADALLILDYARRIEISEPQV